MADHDAAEARDRSLSYHQRTSAGKRSVSDLTSSEAALRRVSESLPSVSRRTYSIQFMSNISSCQPY
jgi:hypothetical protein